MRRILLFTENLGSGGAERQLAGLAVLLKQRGYEVKVLTYLERHFQEQYLSDNGVCHELDSHIVNKLSGLFYLYRKLKTFKPDIVISFLPAPNKRMCLMRPLLRFNLIVSERSNTQRWTVNTVINFVLYYLADHIVANSFAECNNISMHCPWLKKKACAIPNFVDIDKFCPIYANDDKTVRMLCVGRLIPLKNVLRLLEALYIVKSKGVHFSLTWVGLQYDKSYLSEVQSKMAILDLKDCVVLKGQTNDVQREYQSTDVFCLPSLLEGYPNVLVEAMSCGLPVVCSNICEMPNIVTEGVNGFLFDPLDTNDMANAIERMLLLSLEERKQMGLKNRNMVVQNNSMSVFVENYEKLF